MTRALIIATSLLVPFSAAAQGSVGRLSAVAGFARSRGESESGALVLVAIALGLAAIGAVAWSAQRARATRQRHR